MQNILLLTLRQICKQAPATIAAHLGISEADYRKIENGTTLMSPEQTKQLGKLFKVKDHFIYRAALQLEALITRGEMLKLLTMRKEELEERVRKLEKIMLGSSRTSECHLVY